MFKNIREEDKQRADSRKLLEAKIEDKFEFAVSRNKITNTDFLNMSEKNIAEKFLRQNKIKNYLFFGGNGDDSDRHILVFYPEKLSQEMALKNIPKIVSCVQINLPKNLEYEHKIYLSGIMKLGLKREKIGDILVRENGADVIALNETAEFLKNNLCQLTRFQKASCDIIPVSDIEYQEKEFEEISIIVSSMRLDNFVSELAKCSRSKAEEIINQQKVFVNYEMESKFSKKVNAHDVINIRGKGKFIVGEIERKTKAEKLVVIVKKYV